MGFIRYCFMLFFKSDEVRKDGDNIEDLLNYADEKMYEDKKIRV